MAGIKQRGNSYELSVCRGYDSNGKKVKPITKTVRVPDTIKTERQLKKYLDEQSILFENEVKNNLYFNGDNMTFGEYASKWFANAEKNLAPSTLSVYKTRLEKRIIPSLGHIKLSKLQKHHLREFYSSLEEDGSGLKAYYFPTQEFIDISSSMTAKKLGVNSKTLSRLKKGERTNLKTAEKISQNLNVQMCRLFIVDKSSTTISSNTINHHYDLISSILSEAVEDDLIAKNPQPKAPKTSRTKINYYDDKQIRLLLDAFDNEPIKYRVMGYLLVETGIRRSELSGLEWKHIDFENNSVIIEQQRQHISSRGGTIIKSPKTDSGIRVISLSSKVLGMLRAYQRDQKTNRLKMGSEWIESDYVFRHENGKEIATSRSYQWLQNLTKKHGLPKITVHGLRHTNASLLISSNTDIVTLSTRLGHSDKNVTLNTYSHQIRSKEKETANKMDSFYNHDEDSNLDSAIR